MRLEIKQRIAQIQRREVPEGYTKKKQILLPNQWDFLRIQDVAKVSSGSTPNRRNPAYWNGSIAWVTTGELGNGHIYYTLESITENAIAETNLRLYPKGTLLMAMYGQGKTRGTVAILEIDATINQACAAILTETPNIMFLFYQLQKSYEDIRKLSNTGNQENLNADIIKRYRILWAPDDEQQKIAAILTAQDKIIELKEKLLAEKQLRKKYLMQQLLTGKKRLSGFSGEWEEQPLWKISKKQKNKNTGFQYSFVLSNSAIHGIVSQDQEFDKEIVNEERVDSYYIVEPGAFVYNPRISVMAPCGPINVNETGKTGITSPLYTVFCISSTEVSTKFLKYYFQSSCWYRYIKGVANYGARHDRISISDGDFFNMPIALPLKEEQIAIAEVLATADHEIDLLQKDIEQEKQKKKALMQLLLTGIVRVNI